ncbi:MAG: class I SAM-dependent methyltransferase [Prolixibacteraceae bacterium]
MSLVSHLKEAKHKLFPKKEFVIYKGCVLPAKHLRFNGPGFRDNSFYIHTARLEAKRLIEKLGCNSKSHILEIGCGQGRLVTGLLMLIGRLSYVGFDVHLPSVRWCRKYIEKREPSYHFEHLDIASERYHKGGRQIDHHFKFDIPDRSIDIIYIWGVFTNLDGEVMKIYLNDLKRMLAPGGRIFFTAFVEEDVPDISINPKGYLFEEYSSPLQVVRYEKNYLFSLISRAGLVIDDFVYGKEFDGQSEFYLSQKAPVIGSVVTSAHS